MRKPVVAVLVNETPDTDINMEKMTVSTRYVRALEKFTDVHVVAILVKDIVDLDVLHRVDGVLLTGGYTNINPEIYGGDYVLKSDESAPLRDDTAFATLDKAIALGMPILAICRGLQEMNVYHGGTLRGDVHLQDGHFLHKKLLGNSNDDFSIRQDLEISPDSALHQWTGITKTRVNSIHGQAVDIVGDGLVVEAVCPIDGVVEAMRIENYPTFAYATQWHPESQSSFDNPINQAIFEKFSTACMDYMHNTC